MKGLSKMKPAVRYIAIFVAVLLFALRPGAKAQPIVAHGYEFTFGTDSTRWIDIDGVGTFENRYRRDVQPHFLYYFCLLQR